MAGIFATYLTQAELIFKKLTSLLRTSMIFTYSEGLDRGAFSDSRGVFSARSSSRVIKDFFYALFYVERAHLAGSISLDFFRIWNYVECRKCMACTVCIRKGPKAVIQFCISTQVHYSEGTVVARSKV